MRNTVRGAVVRKRWGGGVRLAGYLVAAALAASCRGAPRYAGVSSLAPTPPSDLSAAPSVEPFDGDLFETVADPAGVRANALATRSLGGATVQSARMVRMKPGMLPSADGRARHLRAEVRPGVAIPLWVLAPERIDLGFRRWRAMIDDDPLAWVGIIGSPEPVSFEAAAAAPSHDAGSPAPKEPAAAGGGISANDVDAPLQPAGSSKVDGSPILSRGRLVRRPPLPSANVTILVRSPRYGDYDIVAGGASGNYVVRQMDYSGMPLCGVGREPGRRTNAPPGATPGKRGDRGCGCCCCRGRGQGRGNPAGGGSGQGDTWTAGNPAAGGPKLGFVGTPATKDIQTVELLLLYTRYAMEHAAIIDLMDEAGFQQNLEAWVAYTNDALALCDTRTVIHLADLAMVDDKEKDDIRTIPLYEDLRNPLSLRFAEVHEWRDLPDVRADLVCLVAAPSMIVDDECGYGSVLLTGEQADPSLAFSVVRKQCLGGYSLPHELGHNFGCCHDRGNSSERCHPSEEATYPDPPYGEPTYRHGWPFEGYVTAPDGTQTHHLWTTLMGYPDSGGRTRLLGLSSPVMRAEGSPMGDVDLANNARMIRETAKRVAGYR